MPMSAGLSPARRRGPVVILAFVQAVAAIGHTIGSN
jgi:hypothetical protein